MLYAYEVAKREGKTLILVSILLTLYYYFTEVLSVSVIAPLILLLGLGNCFYVFGLIMHQTLRNKIVGNWKLISIDNLPIPVIINGTQDSYNEKILEESFNINKDNSWTFSRNIEYSNLLSNDPNRQETYTGTGNWVENNGKHFIESSKLPIEIINGQLIMHWENDSKTWIYNKWLTK